MFELIVLIPVFAATLAGAGALFGLSCLNVCRSRLLGVAAIWLGTIVGFGCGCFFGFSGLGGGAATGPNWYGQPLIMMPLTGLGVLVVAVFCLSFTMRIRDRS